MAARRPVLCVVSLALLALCAMWAGVAPSADEAFVANSPALRVTVRGDRGAFAGASQPVVAAQAEIARAALPEPIPDDAILPVDFSRTSLYW
eukprot:CAMPEP_0177193682 /NCGR_PEP_ID=MMETSP0367-20130122/22570_1 /TAXON_ID=447022 ORGANISM="Scrippsiella hangoei-like, Strain SHHI-4" /NCGR_SAMPLE_ID=MMETSP0367 /ASSEMBLY_ACC=CAM_ASM_000362 /LENGTH=91 /DNA_ID=CAMNT_0018641579 /DNA_START=35 /DNA_END=307 /DNA_ORIENTATION=+